MRTSKNKAYTLPLDTVVELVAIKGKNVYKQDMRYEEALLVKKKKGFVYKIYQKGFSQF